MDHENARGYPQPLRKSPPVTAREKPITTVNIVNNVADLPLGDYLRWLASTMEPETRRELERRAASHEALRKACEHMLDVYRQGDGEAGDVRMSEDDAAVLRAALADAREKA